ncbi:MAG: MBL fold metallo-hydrolase [Oscillospiraceae bacterium]|nr:MBL fold metallo-hydrolase [Oscillospiraceae bacterium]
MKVSVFASGSSGNCLLVSSGATHLLVDAGISMRRIDAALAQTGLTLREIGGVLITHEHSDHVSGLPMLTKYHNIPIYAPKLVALRLREQTPALDRCLMPFAAGETLRLGSMAVRAFHTPHDTPESVGYRIEGDGVFALATDMGCVTDEVLRGLQGADTVLIESNHDEVMLRSGPYPFPLKRRILADTGHLSNENCAILARTLAESGTRQIILGHLSRENNTPSLALAASREALVGTDTDVYCAPVLGCLTVTVERREPCFVST